MISKIFIWLRKLFFDYKDSYLISKIIFLIATINKLIFC